MTLADKVNEIRSSLLPETVKYVVNESPYYRRKLMTHYQEIRFIEDLKYLPILHRSDAIANEGEILCNPQPDDLLSFTSGTTSGRPLLIRRSHSELDELRKCINLVQSKGNGAGLIMEEVNSYHGASPLLSGPNVIRVPASVAEHLYWIEKLLSDTVISQESESKVTRLRFIPSTLLWLTLYFLHKGIRPSQFGIEKIVVTGQHVTGTMRAFFEEQWRASLIDSYSLSEFAGNGAIMCDDCGWYHFVLPTVVPEVVDAITEQPIDSGLGVLLLTSLYPFAQRQLFIRYWTDDLVERGPKCKKDDFSFRLRGRRSQSLYMMADTEGVPLILPFDLHEALDSLPDVRRPVTAKAYDSAGEARAARSSFSLTLADASEQFRLAARYLLQDSPDIRPLIRVEVGLRYVPELYLDRIHWLSEYITSCLRAKNQHLASALDTGAVGIDIHFVSPYNSLPYIEF